MKRFLFWLLALVLCAQPVLALDVIQNVARAFVIEAPALDSTDGVTPETGLTMTSFTIRAYKKNKAPLTVTAALAVFASSTLTSTATNPADQDTITFTGTLDGTLITEVKTFKTTLTGAVDEVKIAATASLTLDNVKCAINDSSCVEGTDYGTGTVASVLVNATTKTATTLLVVANIPGTLGNSFTTADAGSQLSWTGSNLASGVDGMIHAASGYHWFTAPATLWDTLGDMLLTFNISGAAPFFQRVKVIANRSNEIGVQGLGATTDELLETGLSTVASSSSWAYKLNNLDIATSAVWDQLRASHVTADTFGEALASTVASRATAAALATVQSDTDDLQSKIGTPAGASLSADVAAVKVDTAAVKVKTDFLPSATPGATGGLFIAGTNAATTVTTAFTSTFTGNLTGSVASVSGAVGSVTGNVGGNVTGNVGGTLGGMTAAALAQFFTVNSGTTYASAVAGSVVKEIVDNASGAGFTVSQIADAVWDEAIAGHLTAGTTGLALNGAASAGDPWSTALPGAYGAGTAGKIVGDNVNATIGSRASQTSLDTAQADLDDLQTRTPAALVSGRMDSSVGEMAASVITAASINADALTAAKFAADASTEFASTLMSTTFEGAHTFRHFLQYGASALFGKYNSAAGTFNFRDLADAKNRIIYSTSSTARTSVTLSPD